MMLCEGCGMRPGKEGVIEMIQKDMTVGQVLRSCAEEALEAVVKVFTDMGMHCLFCPHSTAETLEQAAMVHGNDVDVLVEKLNAVYKARA
jgi:hybrid cluster-associated redox disulfide protein